MVGDKPKHVIILSALPVSDKTGAAFSRMVEYAKGISQNRNDVVVSLASLRHVYNDKEEFLDKERKIRILGKAKSSNKHFYLDRFIYTKYRKDTFHEILDKYDAEDNKPVIFMYPFFNTWYEEKYYIDYCKKKNIKVFSERNERALGIFLNRTRPDGLVKVITFYFIQLFELLNVIKQDGLVKYYNGNIVISSTFEKWIIKRNPNHLRIPILTSRVANPDGENTDNNTFNIGHTGTLSFGKDGLGVMLNSIHLLVKKYNKTNILFNIYGFGRKPDIRKMKRLIQKLDIESYVNFHGMVPSSVARKEQGKQDLLVMLRKSNMQNSFGFSTKLAEYMSTGGPVLVTDVSDNLLFIKDDINAFVCKYDPEDVAKKINKIMSLTQDQKKTIREAAIDTTLKHFSIKTYAAGLQEFLLS